MKIKLPKDLRGMLFPRVLSIELNSFDIDVFLPALFFTILADGRGRAKRANDPTRIREYVAILAQHPMLEGFDDVEGRRVLERLTRTSLIVTGSIGRAKRGEQILSTVPYTILAHKPGFPTEGSRQRNADKFIYQILRDQLGGDDSLRKFVKDVFGKGVVVGNVPLLGGTYDGQTELDTLTRLSIAFLDGFQAIAIGGGRTRVAPPSCPAPAHEFATDLLRYLFAYYDRMPAQALTYYLQALINFELFNYTLKVVHAINALVREPHILPPAMREPAELSPPDLYIDFTGDPRSLSQEMASAGVRRDVEAYQQFLGSNLLLRLLDHYIVQLRHSPARRTELDCVLPTPDTGPAYLQALLLLRSDPAFGSALEASARNDETRIMSENEYRDGDDDGKVSPIFDDMIGVAESDIDRVVALLAEAQRKNALSNYVKWFTGVGGLSKPHGLLSGTARSRRSWRYAPSNDLLNMLVQLAAARSTPDGTGAVNECGPVPIRLQTFLEFLSQRFGIVVDRPPAPFSGADYVAAARDNLRAMLDRLRQMNIFRDLSDDFTVQRLSPPYTTEQADWTEVAG